MIVQQPYTYPSQFFIKPGNSYLSSTTPFLLDVLCDYDNLSVDNGDLSSVNDDISVNVLLLPSRIAKW